MNVREAAEKYNIPPSRIRNAISLGILPKNIVKGSYEFPGAKMAAAAADHTDIIRRGRKFNVCRRNDLMISWKQVEKFQTNAAADEYESLMRKKFPNVRLMVVSE